jgi:hypothetical protein
VLYVALTVMEWHLDGRCSAAAAREAAGAQVVAVQTLAALR